MKSIFVFFFSLLLTSSIFADCGPAIQRLVMDGDTISNQSPVLIRLHGHRDNLKNYPQQMEVVLFNNKKSHLLKLLRFQWGVMEAQAEFALPENITLGKYTVGIRLVSTSKKIPKIKTVILQVGSLYIDNKAPLTNSGCTNSLSLLLTKNVEYGCGPSLFALFDFTTLVNPRQWLRVTLVDQQTGEQMQFYTRPHKEGSLYIGHGMCGGSVKLNKLSNYNITVHAYYPRSNEYCLMASTKLKASDWE